MKPDPDILGQLQHALANAYAPYSGHPVAALAVTADGHQFVGVNVESAHYKGICAEAAALTAMVAAGKRQLRTIYVMGPKETPCPPCGDCRQRIAEFADTDCSVALVSASGVALGQYSIEQLLPDAFRCEQVSVRLDDKGVD